MFSFFFLGCGPDFETSCSASSICLPFTAYKYRMQCSINPAFPQPKEGKGQLHVHFSSRKNPHTSIFLRGLERIPRPQERTPEGLEGIIAHFAPRKKKPVSTPQVPLLKASHRKAPSKQSTSTIESAGEGPLCPLPTVPHPEPPSVLKERRDIMSTFLPFTLFSFSSSGSTAQPQRRVDTPKVLKCVSLPRGSGLNPWLLSCAKCVHCVAILTQFAWLQFFISAELQERALLRRRRRGGRESAALRWIRWATIGHNWPVVDELPGELTDRPASLNRHVPAVWALVVWLHWNTIAVLIIFCFDGQNQEMWFVLKHMTLWWLGVIVVKRFAFIAGMIHSLVDFDWW